MAIPTTAVTRPFVFSSPAISVAATATALAAVAIPGAGSIIRIVNEGPSIAFVALGSVITGLAATLPTAVTGLTTAGSVLSTPILPGSDVSFSRDPATEKFISTICRSGGTATLTVQVGEGL